MNDTHDTTLANAPASRREFTKRAAAFATSATLVLPIIAGAQTTPPATREATAPPNPSPSPSPAPNKLLDAYAEVARERFGAKLSAEEMERVRNDLAGNLRTSKRFSEAKLANADEPDFIFRA